MLEPFSPIIEYYPADFTSDPNGKRQAWEAIVQIPFIESEILLDTLNTVIDKDTKAESEEDRLLTNGERLRNQRGKSHLFVAPEKDSPERANIQALAMSSVASTGNRRSNNGPRGGQGGRGGPSSGGRGRRGPGGGGDGESRRQQGNPRRPKNKR
jgi:hypothetical protein